MNPNEHERRMDEAFGAVRSMADDAEPANDVQQYVIEKGVPLTKISVLGSNGTYKYPFRQMEVGDSFSAGEYSARLQSRVSGSVAYVSRATGFKFAARKHEGNLRVWRIK